MLAPRHTHSHTTHTRTHARTHTQLCEVPCSASSKFQYNISFELTCSEGSCNDKELPKLAQPHCFQTCLWHSQSLIERDRRPSWRRRWKRCVNSLLRDYLGYRQEKSNNSCSDYKFLLPHRKTKKKQSLPFQVISSWVCLLECVLELSVVGSARIPSLQINGATIHCINSHLRRPSRPRRPQSSVTMNSF